MSDTDDHAPLAPFKVAVFRLLWPTWLVVNLCIAMNDVAAAWMMNSMTTAPIWVAAVLSVVVLAGGMSPVLLLALIFANGIGMTMRWPVFSVIEPEIVPRVYLPAP